MHHYYYHLVLAISLFEYHLFTSVTLLVLKHLTQKAIRLHAPAGVQMHCMHAEASVKARECSLSLKNNKHVELEGEYQQFPVFL